MFVEIKVVAGSVEGDFFTELYRLDTNSGKMKLRKNSFDLATIIEI
jgi:hypothetical protein